MSLNRIKYTTSTITRAKHGHDPHGLGEGSLLHLTTFDIFQLNNEILLCGVVVRLAIYKGIGCEFKSHKRYF